MKQIYVISCTFVPRKGMKAEPALAFCEDPNTPKLFIRANGKPYLGKTVWSYDLYHDLPWAKLAIVR